MLASVLSLKHYEHSLDKCAPDDSRYEPLTLTE